MNIIKRIKYTDIFAYLTGIASSLLIAQFSDDTIWPFLGFFLFFVSILLVLYPAVLLSSQLYPSFKSIRTLAISHLFMLCFGWILVYSILFINPWLAFIGIIFLVINLKYQKQIEDVYQPSEDPHEFTWLKQDSNALLRTKMLLLFGLGFGMVLQVTISMDSVLIFVIKTIIAVIGLYILFLYYRYAYQWIQSFHSLILSIIGIIFAVVYIQFDDVWLIAFFIGLIPTLYLERQLTKYIVKNRDSMNEL